MSTIQVEQLTKTFGAEKGIFDVSFAMTKGEVFGFLGPNGAGKTTTIRHLLGFSRPQSGSSTILGMDCWTQSKEIHRHLGYLPAEIAFPEKMTGMGLIRYLADMRKLRDLSKAEELIQRFQLDPSAKIDRMSKGTKQKIAIVCAFMHSPEILILDEPTTGLDPLMQSVFIELIREEKQRGASILMSSHVFEEIEGTCDRLGIIRKGRMVSMLDMKDLRKTAKRTYVVDFAQASELESMENEAYSLKEIHPDAARVVIEIEDVHINELLRQLSARNVKSVSEIQSSLGEHFMGLYKGDASNV